MPAIRLYLAGPDVFHPHALQLGAAKKALCVARGCDGLYPLDAQIPPAGPAETSRAIYAACRTMMEAADGGIFNLTPFRGPSADVGTVLELGHMAATGKPVFAYTNAPGDLIDRLRLGSGLVRDAATGRWRDAEGLEAEDFGNADNLMLDETLRAQGRRIHRSAAPGAALTDLSGFVACLDEAVAVLAARPTARRRSGSVDSGELT